MSGLLLILAIMPVVVICTYIYLKDRNKEPWPLLVGLFIMGILSCFLVLFVSDVLFKIIPFMEKDTSFMSFFEVMAYAFIGVALVEELCKWLMTFIAGYHSKAYDEVYDGIVYAVYVSLGFACFENILYVFANKSIVVGISRSILAVPGHACDAVFMGYYLSLAKVYAAQGNKKLERKNLILSVLVPTILHGIYDFCLFSNIDILLLVFLTFVIVIYIFSIKKIKLLSAQCKNNYSQQQTATPKQQYSYTSFTPQPQFASSTSGGYINSGYVNPQNYQNGGYVNQQTQQNAGYVNPQNYQNGGYVNQQTQQNAGYINPQSYQNSGYVNQQTQQNTGYVNPPNYQNNNYPNINQRSVTYCALCGTQINNGICPNCGSRQN